MSLLREPSVCNRPHDRIAARRRRAFLALLLALALGAPPILAQPPSASKEKNQGKPPKPLEKSQSKSRAAPAKAQPSAAAPPKTPTPSPPQPSQRVAIPPPDLSKPPPMLPVASREKMRACADAWSKLRMEQKEPLPLWRDFANKCLTR